MKPFGSARSPRLIHFLLILGSYAATSGLILLLAILFLDRLSSGEIFESYFLVPLGIALPLLLLAIVLYQLFQNYRELKKKSPGARYKRVLTLHFTLVVFLASIPQGVLSVGFVNSTMNSWFSTNLEEALNGGVDVALHYYRATVDSMDSFSTGALLETILKSYHKQPNRVWETVKQANPQVDALQLFNSIGESSSFFGQGIARKSGQIEVGRPTGILPKDDLRDIGLIRAQVSYQVSGERHYALLTVLLPEKFDDRALSLTRALESFSQYRTLREAVFLAIVFCYFTFSFPILLVSLLVSFNLSKSIVEPIVRLEAATRQVADGDYSFIISSRYGDELSVLINSFNYMVAELENSRRKLIQTEKFAAWQEIAQRLAHEIMNPLTPIKLSAELMIKKQRDGTDKLEKLLPQSMKAIITEVDNLTLMLQEFRDFARLPSPVLKPVHLGELVDEVILTYGEHLPEVSVDTSQIDRSIIIEIDRMQIKRVFSNLLKNAFDAMDQTGTVSISAHLVRKGNTSYSRISVSDTGTGIPDEEQSQIFNPYYTTKNGGTGLGLAIAERIVFDHKGEIWVATSSKEGTTIQIDLPIERGGLVK